MYGVICPIMTEQVQLTAVAIDIPLSVVISGVYSQKIAPKLISKAVEKMTIQASYTLEVVVDGGSDALCVKKKNTHRVMKPSIAPVNIKVLRPK
jgi:hypothetical protein